MVISDVTDSKFYQLPPEKENTVTHINLIITEICSFLFAESYTWCFSLIIFRIPFMR